jgi:hypothetical protein
VLDGTFIESAEAGDVDNLKGELERESRWHGHKCRSERPGSCSSEVS